MYVDWSRLEETSSGTVSGNVLSWNKEAVNTLSRLSPSQDGMMEFSIPIASSTASSTSRMGFQVTAEATMGSVGGVVVKRTVRTRPMVIQIHSDAAVSSEARYFTEEGAPIGSGPLPPVSGATTTYRIFWDLSKTFHELNGVQVHATLPKNVTWAGSASTTAGDVTYDASSRTITWSVNRLPQDVNVISAVFDMMLLPSELDVGRFADLLSETRLDATDADIQKPIIQVTSRLTTDLQNDDGAKSKGVVRKQ
jgi:hypothetical protein